MLSVIIPHTKQASSLAIAVLATLNFFPLAIILQYFLLKRSLALLA